MSAEDVLEHAAALVERLDGWCQGVSYTEDGAVCMHWAIEQASYGVSWEAVATAYDAAMAELGLPTGNLQGMVRWNDTPGRNAVEVATVLRNAKRNIVVPA